MHPLFEIDALTPVGDAITAGPGAWTFAGIADRFPDHIRRSLPGYEAGHQLVEQLSDYFVTDDAVVYELGTSVGELLCKLIDRQGLKL